MMNDDKSDSFRDEILEKNKILYCCKSLPMSETCMCWGLEVGNGWLNAVDAMSSKLEALNLLFYPKWKVRIQMDQVKEKFGTLRAYFSVVCDDAGVLGKVGRSLKRIGLKLKRSVDFKLHTVVDREECYTDETEELTEEQYSSYKKCKCIGGSLRESGGKFYRDYKLYHSCKSHVEPAKHKLLYKAASMLVNAGCKIASLDKKKMSDAQYVVMTALDSLARIIVKHAEDECYETCEECGCQIGSDWSPRCETAGWVTYLCDRCAAKTDSFYYKNGAKWHGDQQVMTKEEVEAERKKVEDKTEELEDTDDEDKR